MCVYVPSAASIRSEISNDESNDELNDELNEESVPHSKRIEQICHLKF